MPFTPATSSEGCRGHVVGGQSWNARLQASLRVPGDAEVIGLFLGEGGTVSSLPNLLRQ